MKTALVQVDQKYESEILSEGMDTGMKVINEDNLEELHAGLDALTHLKLWKCHMTVTSLLSLRSGLLIN